MWICLEVAVSIAILAPSVALADRWSPLQAASYKPGLGACQTEGDRTACIVVRCDQLEGLQILVFDDGEGGAIADQLTFKVGAWTGQTTFERMENGDLKRRLALTSPLLAQLSAAREVNLSSVERGYNFTIKNISDGARLHTFAASCRR